MLKVSAVIATYNRPEVIVSLVQSLKKLRPAFEEIIVIDSSDEENAVLKQDKDVAYIRSSHKNQPYQRLVGNRYARSEYLLYLDDDMIVADEEKLVNVLTNELGDGVAGLALNFKDLHDDTVLKSLPVSVFKKNNTSLKARIISKIRAFTGYPVLPEGRFYYCGNRGKQPAEGGATEWISGGAFVAKRDLMYRNMNLRLLDLFEEKTGMGEDAILGYALSIQGRVKYIPELVFYHNDQRNSTYTVNLSAYGKRVTFSRLYLSMEYARLKKSSLFLSVLYYHWYTLWRVAGMIINVIIKPSAMRREILKGSLKGWIKAFSFRFKSKLQRNEFWLSEADRDIQGLRG